MNQLLDQKSIIKKTMQVGGTTLLSRGFGLLREVLRARYLGTGAIADAFLMAFMLPNSLRKVFAEGALTAAFVPTIVSIVKNDDLEQANSLMSTAFIFFEGLLAIVCLVMFFKAQTVIGLVAPGFDLEKTLLTAKLLKILCTFIIFVSSSSLLAGALQAVNHFTIPAVGPVLLNIIFIAALGACLFFNWPIEYLCYAILFSGVISFILHLITYFAYGFGFGKITKKSIYETGNLVLKFLPVMISMSIMEINLFIDMSFSSYLPDGSMAIINYANRFMGIPLGVFAVAFSTILLPHFARVKLQEPEKLSFNLFEAAKLVMFVTIPCMIFMMFFAQEIFQTIFLSTKFPMDKIIQAGWVLMAFLGGLFFFSLNKILLNIYYVLHDTLTPMAISIFATLANFILNYLLVSWLKAPGLAVATSISGFLQTVLFIYFLHSAYQFNFHTEQALRFFWAFLKQLICLFSLFGLLYWLIKKIILNLLASFVLAQKFLLLQYGLWLWVGPIFVGLILAFYYTRKFFGLELSFLD
jgi:putative peptidoglycan lipid II flippase